MTKKVMQISFSGGRTSGYMAKQLLDNYSDEYDFIVTFANTGLEHLKTLDFVNNCDKYFNFNTVWLETQVVYGERKSSGHKIVTFDTAARDGSPFEAYIKKYGIPNVAFPSCTRELKVNPMQSYLKSIGISHRTIPTAIGIRADESRRVSKQAECDNIVYPLIDWFPTDKIDILNWWEDQPFDLDIDEFEGNCQGCFKKSFKKQFMQIERDASVFDFHKRMEALYTEVGPQYGNRVFFRGNRSTEMLFKLKEESGSVGSVQVDEAADGGCSESCEVYEMEAQ